MLMFAVTVLVEKTEYFMSARTAMYFRTILKDAPDYSDLETSAV